MPDVTTVSVKARPDLGDNDQPIFDIWAHTEKEDGQSYNVIIGGHVMPSDCTDQILAREKQLEHHAAETARLRKEIAEWEGYKALVAEAVRTGSVPGGA